MITLKCKCGQPIQVDDDTNFRLLTMDWRCMEGGAVKATLQDKSFVQLSHLIFKPKPGETVDHADINIHNNRKNNLRSATLQEQNWNRRVSKRSLTGYKGVCYERRNGTNPYKAKIHKDGVDYRLGIFKTAIEAARAYNEKAKELYGEFAYLNPDV